MYTWFCVPVCSLGVTLRDSKQGGTAVERLERLIGGDAEIFIEAVSGGEEDVPQALEAPV